jgi:hypothetical protein
MSAAINIEDQPNFSPRTFGVEMYVHFLLIPPPFNSRPNPTLVDEQRLQSVHDGE